MRYFRVIAKFILVASGMVILALLVLTAVYKDKVAGIFISEINSRSEINISISGSRLSLLKRFPRASFELSEIVVTNPVPGFTNDTIVKAAVVSFGFRLYNLLKKNYNIEWLNISDGEFYILTDSTGTSNLPHLTSGTHVNETGLEIDLKDIRISDFAIIITNDLKRSDSKTHIGSGRLSGRISGSDIGMKADGDFTIQNLMLNGIELRQELSAGVALDIHKSDTSITIRKGAFKLENMDFSALGNYNPGTREINLSVSADKADIVSASGFIPDKYRSWLKYRPAGKVSAICHISGLLTSKSQLHYEVAFSMNGVKLDLPGSDLRIRESSLSGFYTTGNLNNAVSSELAIDRFDIKTVSSQVKGSLSVRNFNNPILKTNISTTIDLEEIKNLFANLPVNDIRGTLSTSLSLSGPLSGNRKLTIKSAAEMNPRGTFFLNSVSFQLRDYQFENISGNLMLAEHIWIDSLRMTLAGGEYIANGTINSFTKWIQGTADHVEMNGFIGVSSLNPELFPQKDKSVNRKSATLKLPAGYTVNLAFTAGEFLYKSFLSNNLAGVLKYKNGVLKIEDISLNSMGGAVEGSALLAHSGKKGFISECDLTFRDIDINSAFVSFRDFGQQFIQAENLKGNLSGTYNMRMNLDSLLKPDSRSISSGGSFAIDNGELNNFAPIMKMSKFIEINELENIRFSRLENDFYINSGTFAIPQMEIKSSAADLGISGKHNFNGDYEYHLRVLLSQILSKKAPKKTPNNEFGIVEDDGLGRTSIFLTLTREGGKESMAYDARAMKSEVRQDLQKEKQSLKGILKEEFGWYGSDTTIVPSDETKPKFRIIWDEGIIQDTIKVDSLIQNEKSPVRNLLKRIIKG